MDAAETERIVAAATLRVKFQNVDPDGHDYAGSRREYPFFWEGLPDGWRVDAEHAIDTYAGTSIATVLRGDDDETLIAVEHETGLEIVIPLLAPVALKAVSTAAVAVVEWAWTRWRQRRAELDEREAKEPYSLNVRQPPRDSQLRVERTIEKPDGTKTTEVVTIDNPTEAVMLAALTGNAA